MGVFKSWSMLVRAGPGNISEVNLNFQNAVYPLNLLSVGPKLGQCVIRTSDLQHQNPTVPQEAGIALITTASNIFKFSTS